MPTFALLGTHDTFAYNIASDGTYIYATSTPAAPTHVRRYDIADASNTEGAGVAFFTEPAGEASSGVAASATGGLYVHCRRFFDNYYTLYSVDSAGSGTLSGSAGTFNSAGRTGWNPTTGTVWHKRATDLYEWVSNTTHTSRNSAGTTGAATVPHTDSTGAVWFTRSYSGVALNWEVCRWDGSTLTVVHQSPQSLTRWGPESNTGFVFEDEFVFNDNGTWKKVTAGGTVTTASFMSGAPAYTDSYTATEVWGGAGGAVIAFEGVATSTREMWRLTPDAATGEWRVGGVG